jgi:hypothetical protein
VGFAVPVFHWFFYLPGVFLRRLMILIGLRIGIPAWTALGLEFGFNVGVLFAVIFLGLSILAPRRAS